MCYVTVQWWFCSPPLLPFPPPPRFSRVPCPLQFACSSRFPLPPLRSCHLVAPSPSPAASDSPLSVRWAPPADSSSGRQPNQKCPLLGSGAPRFWCVTALCGWWYLAWVWVGGLRRRRPPRFSLSWRVDRLFAGQMATAFLLDSLSPTAFVETLPRQSFLGARLLLPPSPSPVPHTLRRLHQIGRAS